MNRPWVVLIVAGWLTPALAHEVKDGKTELSPSGTVTLDCSTNASQSLNFKLTLDHFPKRGTPCDQCGNPRSTELEKGSANGWAEVSPAGGQFALSPDYSCGDQPVVGHAMQGKLTLECRMSGTKCVPWANGVEMSNGGGDTQRKIKVTGKVNKCMPQRCPGDTSARCYPPTEREPQEISYKSVLLVCTQPRRDAGTPGNSSSGSSGTRDGGPTSSGSGFITSTLPDGGTKTVGTPIAVRDGGSLPLALDAGSRSTGTGGLTPIRGGPGRLPSQPTRPTQPDGGP